MQATVHADRDMIDLPPGPVDLPPEPWIALWTRAHTRAIRVLRLRMLTVQFLLVGAQWAVYPRRAWTLPAYRVLRPIEVTGWRIIGVALIAVAVALMWERTQATAIYVLGVFLLTLGLSQLRYGYLPAWLVIPACMCILEIRTQYQDRPGP